MHNAAQLIRNDCVLIDFNNKRFDHAEIQQRKRFLKNQIDRAFAGQALGKTIFIDINRFDWVVPSILAVWEMGCNIFVHDLNSEFTKIPEFKDFYNFIDSAVVQGASSFNKFAITYPLIDIDAYQHDCADIAGAQDRDLVAVKTHTSGTTGIPKIIDFTHGQVIDRTISITPFHRYSEQDRPFHFKTFHHGALFLDYALPLLSVAQDHYFISTGTFTAKTYNARDYLNRVLPYIAEHKLTAMLMPYEWINYFDQATPIDMQGRLSIRTLRGYDANTAAWIFENINPRDIVNQFGCSELGTMFVARVTQDNYKNYDARLFGESAPDVEFQFEPTLVRAQRRGQQWHTLADSFEQRDNGLYYRGRTYSIVLDNETVPLQPLEDYLKTQYHITDFQLVPDFTNNNLYLALFDSTLSTDLDQINQQIANKVSSKHCITDVRYFDLATVVSGIKPSGQIILYAFTKDKNDIQPHQTT